jgi:hypothetical protein
VEKKAGQPTKYKKAYAKIAEKACANNGFDDESLADLFSICDKTLNNWKNKHPEFLQSIKRGKDTYDTNNVETSLLKRAEGYSYIEKHTEAIIDSDGKISELKKVKNITKEIPPETTAGIFWLKNRHPGRWRDIKAIELTGKDGGPIEQKVTIYLPENKRDK